MIKDMTVGNPTGLIIKFAIPLLIGNLFQVDEKYSKAMEIALGASKQFIVVDDSNSAKDAIRYLKENLGIELLDDKTKEIIEYREKYPEASLLELSEIISYETGKSITKSGLNHRFRKIRELAEKMRKQE